MITGKFNPKPHRSIVELKELDTKQLHAYFAHHAGFDRFTPSSGYQYRITLGTKILHDADTRSLWKQFREAVKNKLIEPKTI